MSGGWQHWQGGQLPGSPAGGGPPSPCCVPTPRCYLEPQAFLPMPPHGPPPPGSAPSSPRQAPRGLAWGRGRGQAPAREAAGTERPAGAGSERGCFGPRLGAGRHGALTASGLRAEGAARPSAVQVSSPPHCHPPLEVPWGPPRLRRRASPVSSAGPRGVAGAGACRGDVHSAGAVDCHLQPRHKAPACVCPSGGL